MIKLLSVITLMVFISLTSVVYAQSSSIPTALSSTSSLGVALEKMSKLVGFSTPFEQILSYAEGGQKYYSGELAVLRPGKFRWHYTKPYEQLFVSDGDGIWLYEPDLMQVQKLQDLGELDPIVMQLLDGRVGLQDVSVLGVDKEEDVDVWHVQLGHDTQAVEAWLGVQHEKLVWIENRDLQANKNRLMLLNIDATTPAKNTFMFVAPEGVDVIGAL